MTWGWSPPLLHPLSHRLEILAVLAALNNSSVPALLALCLPEASSGATDNNW